VVVVTAGCDVEEPFGAWVVGGELTAVVAVGTWVGGGAVGTDCEGVVDGSAGIASPESVAGTKLKPASTTVVVGSDLGSAVTELAPEGRRTPPVERRTEPTSPSKATALPADRHRIRKAPSPNASHARVDQAVPGEAHGSPMSMAWD
jgi:hypothetical protein